MLVVILKTVHKECKRFGDEKVLTKKKRTFDRAEHYYKKRKFYDNIVQITSCPCKFHIRDQCDRVTNDFKQKETKLK